MLGDVDDPPGGGAARQARQVLADQVLADQALADQALAAEPHAAGAGLQDPGEQAQQRALAGAVGAHHRHALPGADLEVERAEGDAPPFAPNEAGGGEQRGGRGRSRSHGAHRSAAASAARSSR